MSTRALYKRYIGDADIELLYVEVGKRIRKEREAVGISQGMLSRLIGIKRPSLTLMESGRQRIQLHTLYAIANALDVPVAVFQPSQDE